MTKKKLLLISANRYAVPYPVYPLGISYLESYLQKRLTGFEIRVFDFNLHAEEEFVACLNQFQPDYTGLSIRNVDDISSMSREFFLTGYKEVIDLIRETIQTTLIIGGSAFSIFPKKLFSYLKPDYGIFGEGEAGLYRLLSSLQSGTPDYSIEGLVYQLNSEVVANPRKSYLRSPDLSFSDDLTLFYWEKSGMMNIQTKRGCPYA
ncbi:MAG: cobalamin-dependent protein, partial [Bacteroidales bacterium]|nr:cobalamin-dependent protein [Bacteroidales bacterium]